MHEDFLQKPCGIIDILPEQVPANGEGMFFRKPVFYINEEKRFIGVDGCRDGWAAAVLEDGEIKINVFKDMESLIRKYPKFDAFLIDMAIGLPGSKEENQMRPDAPARKMLSPRGSTIFPVPCRQAVQEYKKERQKSVNEEVLGKSLSEQTINIIPKIRELDEFLRLHSKYKNVICESHPELCFTKLKGEVLLSKKNTNEGFEERKKILSAYLPSEKIADMKEKAKELGCHLDDVVDAVCLAIVAALKEQGLYATVPDDPKPDQHGLKMQIVIPALQKE